MALRKRLYQETVFTGEPNLPPRFRTPGRWHSEPVTTPCAPTKKLTVAGAIKALQDGVEQILKQKIRRTKRIQDYSKIEQHSQQYNASKHTS